MLKTRTGCTTRYGSRYSTGSLIVQPNGLFAMHGKKLLWTSLLLVVSQLSFAQRTDAVLQQKLLALCRGFGGSIGFYVKDLRSGRVASYQADTVFPTASIVKVPILLGIMDKLEKNELQYHQRLLYKDSLLYPGEDILGSFKNGESIELSKLMMLMCTTSDNTASLWLQALAGGGSRINQLLQQQGCTATFVNSRTPGREEARRQFGWGQTTPADMVRLWEALVKRQLLSNQSSERMLKILGRNYWDEEGLSAIPAGVFVASKNGAVDASRSEVMYVNAGKRPYILAVFTKNNTDKSWTPDNEAWVLTRRISQLVWSYFSGR